MRICEHSFSWCVIVSVYTCCLTTGHRCVATGGILGAHRGHVECQLGCLQATYREGWFLNRGWDKGLEPSPTPNAFVHDVECRWGGEGLVHTPLNREWDKVRQDIAILIWPMAVPVFLFGFWDDLVHITPH